MSIFVDTGVFYAQQHEAASRHGVATDALREVLTGRFGTAYTSDYVHDEAVTLVRARTGQYGAAKRVSERILGDESPISLLYVGKRHLRESLETFERYSDQELSFTDATTVPCSSHVISTRCSASTAISTESSSGPTLWR